MQKINFTQLCVTFVTQYLSQTMGLIEQSKIKPQKKKQLVMCNGDGTRLDFKPDQIPILLKNTRIEGSRKPKN